MLRRFFQDYKQLEGKAVEVDEIRPAKPRLPVIEDALARYREQRHAIAKFPRCRAVLPADSLGIRLTRTRHQPPNHEHPGTCPERQCRVKGPFAENPKHSEPQRHEREQQPADSDAGISF